MSLLKLNIATLSGIVFSEEIDMVVIPGIYGDMSLNSSGRDFAHLLSTGIIYVYKGSQISNRFLIFSGSVLSKEKEIFISVNQFCLNLDKIDNNYFDTTIKKYENLLSNSSNENERDFFKKEIDSYNKAKSLIGTSYYK